MAFSPIKSFRKHTKYWMAGLILVSMVTFVLCTGLQGDFGSWLLSLFGGRYRGEPMARIDGKTYYGPEVANVLTQRKVANQFMIQATRAARVNQAFDLVSKLDLRPRPTKGDIWLMFQTLGQPAGQNLVFQELSRWRASLGETGKVSQREQFSQVQGLFFEALMRQPVEKTGRYFDGGDDNDGLFEFLLWRNEADRLDIKLVDDGVRAEVAQAAHDLLSDKDWQDIVNVIRQTTYNQANDGYVLNALRDEFRVRLAKTWHLGYRPDPGKKPEATITPDRLWRFYKDNRSEFMVHVLPVPVEGFVARVKTPSETVLKAFFNRHKGQEKDPASDQPGFRLPQRVRVGWLQGNADGRFYRRLADATMAVTSAALPLSWNAILLNEYNQKRFDYRLPPWSEPLQPKLFLEQLDKRWKRPEHAAAVVGQALSPTAFLSVPSVAYADAYGRAAREELDKRAGVAATMVLAGHTPFAGVPGVQPTAVPVAQLWAHASSFEGRQSLPLSAVQDSLVREVRKRIARQELEKAWGELEKKLREYDPGKYPVEIRRPGVMGRLKDAAQKNHFTFGESDQALNKDDVEAGRDTDLDVLKKAFVPGPAGFGGANRFADLLFQNADVFIPQDLGTDFEKTGKRFLVWKTEVLPARVPAFDEVRDEVIKQWKFEQARKLARRRADDLARRLARLKPDDDEGRERLLADFQEQLHKEKILPANQHLIELSRVAPLTRPPEALPSAGRYDPYKLPSGVFDHPRDKEWAEKILALGKDGRKVPVLVNRPDSVYYVAARVKEPWANRNLFLEAFRNKTDELWTLAQEKVGKDFREEVVAQLKEQQGFKDLRTEESRKRERTAQ